jgi:hypothetical protein
MPRAPQAQAHRCDRSRVSKHKESWWLIPHVFSFDPICPFQQLSQSTGIDHLVSDMTYIQSLLRLHNMPIGA